MPEFAASRSRRTTPRTGHALESSPTTGGRLTGSRCLPGHESRTEEKRSRALTCVRVVRNVRFEVSDMKAQNEKISRLTAAEDRRHGGDPKRLALLEARLRRFWVALRRGRA